MEKEEVDRRVAWAVKLFVDAGFPNAYAETERDAIKAVLKSRGLHEVEDEDSRVVIFSGTEGNAGIIVHTLAGNDDGFENHVKLCLENWRGLKARAESVAGRREALVVIHNPEFFRDFELPPVERIWFARASEASPDSWEMYSSIYSDVIVFPTEDLAKAAVEHIEAWRNSFPLWVKR